MSKIVLYPANGYDFDAADVAAYLAGLTSGVFSSAEDFPVTAAGGLEVTVSAGRAWVHPSRFTGYSITKREADTLTLPLADPSLPRIDRIVMRYDAGARAASLQVLQGTASSTPTAPAISRTELIYDLCLAEITRPAGSTSISTGQITDTRLDEALCGIVRDGVTGIPSDELLAQAKARIGALEERATGSATAADQSAKAAKDSERAAATAAGTATTKAAAAKGSAEQAATSEANAKASKETAVKKAGEANTSASAAARSQQDAAASKQAAAISEANAKAAADRAALIAANAYVYAYDLTLSKGAWVAATEADATAAGLAYQYDYAIADCTERLEPSATVSMASTAAAQKCGLGVVCQSMAGACRFYAMALPESDIALRLLLTNRNPNQEG